MSILLTILKIILYVILAVICAVLILSIFPVSAKVLFRAGKLQIDAKYLFIKYRIMPRGEDTSETAETSEEVHQPAEEVSETPEQISYAAPELPSHEDISPLEESIVQELEQEDSEETETEQPEQEHTEPDPSYHEPINDHHEEETQPEAEDEEKENGLVALWNKIKPFVTPVSKTLVALFHHIHMKDVEIVWNVRSDDAARVGMLSGLAWMVIGEIMKTLALLFGKNLTYKEITVMPCFDPKDGADERFGCEVAVRPIIILLIAIYFLFEYLKGKMFSR